VPSGQQYVHLHVHSEYSILDGACRIEPLVARAAERFEALGLGWHAARTRGLQSSQ